MPREEVSRVIAEAPLDPDFASDIVAATGATISEDCVSTDIMSWHFVDGRA